MNASARRPRTGRMISAVSVAVPGTVNVAEGVVVKAPNVPCLDGFRLAAALRERTRVAGDSGERCERRGDRRDVARRRTRLPHASICVTLGTGVGGGIILDGKLWRGVDGSAAEIGHIGVDPFGGVACTCGSRGCLEVYASATAIVRMTREARPRYPNSILHNTRRSDFGRKSIRRALEGDELALEVFGAWESIWESVSRV